MRACRESTDRLSVIVQHIPAAAKTVLDIGSNTGYFLFSLNEMGFYCHGLEIDPDLVHFTNLAAFIKGSRGLSCECGKLNKIYVDSMPPYDVVICLSVMHHIVMADGLDEATALLCGLAQKTKQVFFFEMGQSNEIMADWAKRLPAMSPTPERWIADWLARCGFKRVKNIGTSRTTVPRFIFACYP